MVNVMYDPMNCRDKVTEHYTCIGLHFGGKGLYAADTSSLSEALFCVGCQHFRELSVLQKTRALYRSY
jgi:hypothetical protein